MSSEVRSPNMFSSLVRDVTQTQRPARTPAAPASEVGRNGTTTVRQTGNSPFAVPARGVVSRNTEELDPAQIRNSYLDKAANAQVPLYDAYQAAHAWLFASRMADAVLDAGEMARLETAVDRLHREGDALTPALVFERLSQDCGDRKDMLRHNLISKYTDVWVKDGADHKARQASGNA
jgi:hypothetical protein